jgi:hypothetical protein
LIGKTGAFLLYHVAPCCAFLRRIARTFTRVHEIAVLRRLEAVPSVDATQNQSIVDNATAKRLRAWPLLLNDAAKGHRMSTPHISQHYRIAIRPRGS